MTNEFKPITAISTYHQYILEAVGALRLSLWFLEQAKKVRPDIGSDPSAYYADMNSRYSFLMITNAIESAANALLLDLNLNQQYYEELERLNTLLKFQIYCDFKGKKLDTSNIIYGRMKDIVSARNEFVHPKPKLVEYGFDQLGRETYNIKRSKNRDFPFYFFEFSPEDSVTALDDTLNFLSWVMFDICGHELQDGALKIGYNALLHNGDIATIESMTSIKFDKRTFGVR